MKTSTFKFGVMLMAASLVFGAASCKKGCTDPTAINYDANAKKDDGTCIASNDTTDDTVVEKFGMITQDETWTANNIYQLNGKVVVDNGVTLTIEAGTIIKGSQGTGTLASALVVAQGGKVMANGTAAAPIIMTSVLDNIQPGSLTGTNLSETDQGLWGGLIVLGNAPISAADGDVLSQIEGIPTDDTFGAFGGSDAADNSGVYNYISIRHGGALIGAGNEINGFTCGGVGSGTTISNIEVVANLDDGIEFFGGTNDASNILIAYQGDDGVDIDMNYSGTVSNFMVVNGSNSDEALEIDGPEGSTYTSGLFGLTNGTCYEAGATGANGDFKSKAQGTITGVSLGTGTAKIRASFENACANAKTDAWTYLTQASPILVFTGSEFGAVSVYTTSDDGATPTPNTCPLPANYQTDAEGVMTSTTATGMTQSTFSWTWTAINNKF